MSQVLYSLAILACPVGMGLMMWMMMRGGHAKNSSPTPDTDIARLRAEVDQLRAAQRDSTATQPAQVAKPR